MEWWVHPKKRAETSGGFRNTTNNRMEIFAAIAGLEMLKQPCKANNHGRCSNYIAVVVPDALSEKRVRGRVRYVRQGSGWE
jgi:ribonuclease HI